MLRIREHELRSVRHSMLGTKAFRWTSCRHLRITTSRVGTSHPSCDKEGIFGCSAAADVEFLWSSSSIGCVANEALCVSPLRLRLHPLCHGVCRGWTPAAHKSIAMSVVTSRTSVDAKTPQEVLVPSVMVVSRQRLTSWIAVGAIPHWQSVPHYLYHAACDCGPFPTIKERLPWTALAMDQKDALSGKDGSRPSKMVIPTTLATRN